MLGGSHSYGLNTPQSDVDYVGIYMNTAVADIVGIRSGVNDNVSRITEEVDEKYYELRRFLNLLRQGNTQAAEILYSKEYEFCVPEIEHLRKHKRELLDTHRMFNVLRGYAQGELKLANGERTGKLGGKRREALDKFGFSPKNFVQLFRLLWVGEMFFLNGVYPVKVKEYDEKFHNYLMDVKTNPQSFTKAELNSIALVLEKRLVDAFETRDKSKDRAFNEALANEACLRVYAPLIAYEFLNTLKK